MEACAFSENEMFFVISGIDVVGENVLLGRFYGARFLLGEGLLQEWRKKLEFFSKNFSKKLDLRGLFCDNI